MTENNDKQESAKEQLHEFEQEFLRYLTIKNIIRVLPKYDGQIRKIVEMKKDKIEQHKNYSDEDKFALGVTNLSLDDDVMIGLKLKDVDQNGKLILTEKGFLMAMGIYNKIYSGRSQFEQVMFKKKVLKRRNKNKLAKKARRKK